jgi:hypothetical protein
MAHATAGRVTHPKDVETVRILAEQVVPEVQAALATS